MQVGYYQEVYVGRFGQLEEQIEREEGQQVVFGGLVVVALEILHIIPFFGPKDCELPPGYSEILLIKVHPIRRFHCIHHFLVLVLYREVPLK